jgi:hypothetical protein
MHIGDMKNGEADKLRKDLARTKALCKAIWEYHDYIEEIKNYLDNDDLTGADQLWHELDYSTQRLLIIAPLHGGPFNTQERAQIKGLWRISTDDIEGH